MTPSTRADQVLLDAVLMNQSAAFGELYERHREFVWRTALRITGRQDVALDVSQETFTWLLNRCQQRRLRLTAQLSTYLYPVIRSIAMTRMRKDRERTGGLPEVLAKEPSPRSDLAHVLARLPEGQREVLLLRFVEALSLLEIATALGIPSGTVKSRLHHAIQALRDDPATRELLE
jgi:RNA polymerase sigma-70 factor (ECF subfamily)